MSHFGPFWCIHDYLNLNMRLETGLNGAVKGMFSLGIALTE